MNTRQFKCVKLLTQLIQNYGLVGIKTSFQDQGATLNQVIRLKEICNQAKTKITLKIGGPEAIRDIKDSMLVGVKGLVAPMVESPFGLKKFVMAVNNNIPSDVVSTLQLFVNIETITGTTNIENILNISEADNLYGITVGRVDLTGSMNKDRKFVDSDQLYKIVREVFIKTKQKGLKVCLGGAISVGSLDFLNKLNSQRLLDKFETRYAMFDPSITLKKLSIALSKAQMFQYEWLLCKHQNYTMLANQDIDRIKMIQQRINQSMEL